MVRRTKEEAQETRAQIIEAAERAFYKRGVARTTLADIAELAGVTRGAIYWHFNNKAELVQALLDSLHETHDHLARASESEDELTRSAACASCCCRYSTSWYWTPVPDVSMKSCITSASSPMTCVKFASSAKARYWIAMWASSWHWPMQCAWPATRGPGYRASSRGLVRLCRWPDRALVAAAGQFRTAARRGKWVDAGLDMLRLSPALRK